MGHGTPIIALYSGPGMDQSYLLLQMIELAKDSDVIFYDQRSSAKSSTQPLDPDQINIQRFVEDLERLRKYVAFKKMILVGHLLGRLPAAEYAILYPQHVACLIFLISSNREHALQRLENFSKIKGYEQDCLKL